MATYDYPPATNIWSIPETMSWGVETFVAESQSPYTGQIRTTAIPGGRIVVALNFPVHTLAERAQALGWWSLVGMRHHRVRLWHFALPAPRGTMRGSPTVQTGLAPGAESVVLTGMNGTLLRGDIIGLSDGPHVVTSEIVSPVSTVGTVGISPPARASVNSASAATWDRPLVSLLVQGRVDPPFGRGASAGPFSVSLVEAG